MLKQSIVKEAIYKDWALNNEIVLQYCEENHLDMQRLKQMKADYLPDRIVFLQPSSIKPRGYLENDIETQPKAVLGVIISIVDGNISVVGCESTEYTHIIKKDPC